MVAHLDEHMLPISSPRPKLIDTEDLTQETPPEAAISKCRGRGGGAGVVVPNETGRNLQHLLEPVPVPLVKSKYIQR